MIKIDTPTGGDPDMDIKLTVINHGMQLSAEITWREWADLIDDARYLRRYGEARPVA